MRFLEAFAADFEAHGAEVIRIVRMEKPSEYLKTAAYLMPKEFEFTEIHLMEIPDDELNAFIEFASANELDVRYVLDGSVRRQAESLRINSELTDVTTNRTIWARRFDGTNNSLFEFQDRIAAEIVGSLEPRVHAVEVSRVKGRPTESLDAYDCVLKAVSILYHFTDQSFRESGALLDRAIALDPSYAQAYAYFAWRLNFWVGAGARLLQRKIRRARSSLRGGPSSSIRRTHLR